MRYATKVLKNELKIVKRNVDYWKKLQGKQDCESLLQEFIIVERELQKAIEHLEKGGTQPTSSNSDYTAVLYSELMQWNISEDLVIDKPLISKLTTHLNSAIKASQNCA